MHERPRGQPSRHLTFPSFLLSFPTVAARRGRKKPGRPRWWWGASSSLWSAAGAGKHSAQGAPWPDPVRSTSAARPSAWAAGDTDHGWPLPATGRGPGNMVAAVVGWTGASVGGVSCRRRCSLVLQAACGLGHGQLFPLCFWAEVATTWWRCGPGVSLGGLWWEHLGWLLSGAGCGTALRSAASSMLLGGGGCGVVVVALAIRRWAA